MFFNKTEEQQVLEKKEKTEEQITTYYWKRQKDCYAKDIYVYMVDVPRKRLNDPDVLEAKRLELENLTNYETYEVVDYIGQQYIEGKWVCKYSEKQDGSKHAVKARLVAKGFQELEKPKSDAPTSMRESFKLALCIIAQTKFKRFCSIDIKAAFLNGKIERDVFLKPPKDLIEPGKVWRLKRLIYGLNDASRGFWKIVRDLFREVGLVSVAGDEAFYMKRENNKLIAIVTTHVGDFSVGCTEEFYHVLVLMQLNLE